MSLELTPHGKVVFDPNYFRRVRPKFDDFEFRRDGDNTWKVYCPGRQITNYPIAKFTGTYIEGARALKMQLITARLTS